MQDLTACTREELERRSRARAAAVYVGENVVLCRVLEDFSLYVAAEDGSLSPHLMFDGYWESWITLAVARFIRPGMHVVNVGANVGYFAILFAALVGPDGYVTAVEPQLDLCHLIARSAIVNGLSRRLNVVPVAAGDGDASTVIVVNPLLRGMAHVQADGPRALMMADGAAREVAQATLDDILAGSAHRRRVDLLFMDAEGSEQRVLRGATQMLANNPDVTIVMEFIPSMYEDPVGFARELAALGRTMYEITTDGGLREVDWLWLRDQTSTNIVLAKS